MEFIAIDFETANSNRSSACQIGLAKFQDGELKWSKSYLIKPKPNHYDPINVSIHGIDANATKTAPTFKQVWDEIHHDLTFNTLVAHNASFDISVLNAALHAYDLPNYGFNHFCSLTWTKKLVPGLYNYKLSTVSEHFGIELKHHDAESDAIASGRIMARIMKDNGINSFSELIASVPKRVSKRVDLPFNSEIPVTAHPDHPFYGQEIVFTGKSADYTRESLMHMVQEVGGICKTDSLTMTTNFLVVGSLDFKGSFNDFSSGKLKKAKSYIDKGCDIEIIDEEYFFTLLNS